MRHSAALQYVTSMQGVSVRELNKVSPFDQVSQTTLERWATEDEWVRRRQQYFENIRADIESHIAKKMVKVRVEQLKKIDVQVETLFGQIDAVPPKSKEGLITALVRLLEAGDSMREKLAQEVVPVHLGGVRQKTLPLTPQLSEEEARDAALAILRRRRTIVRAKVKAEKQVFNENSRKKPKLRVM